LELTDEETHGRHESDSLEGTSRIIVQNKQVTSRNLKERSTTRVDVEYSGHHLFLAVRHGETNDSPVSVQQTVPVILVPAGKDVLFDKTRHGSDSD
jgi:hypothetical protein